MLKVPAIDIAEVGAGGGSLAGIDKGGLLRVGPESAGADAGAGLLRARQRPADGDGRQRGAGADQSARAGRRPARHRPALERAGDPDARRPSRLGSSLQEAAHGIRAVANAAMARAIRAVTVERGRDPRDLTLVAIGGNGGIHALDVARELGIRRVVVPPLSGVFSAVGMLASDHRAHRPRRPSRRPLDAADESPTSKQMKQRAAQPRSTRRLAADGFTGARVALGWEARPAP